jgi:hypothetical protein
MKPLVMYCRWQSAKLRLMGRSETAVWGELAYQDHSQPFKFQLAESILTLGEGDEARTIILDEMGVEIKNDR